MIDGIIVTFGQEMIKEKGGLLAFTRWFKQVFEFETGYWMHKCKHAPKYDVQYVYISICGRIAWRCQYSGHYPAGSNIGQLMPGAEETPVDWPYIVLSGPLIDAPGKINRKGFQGFRYTQKIF